MFKYTFILNQTLIEDISHKSFGIKKNGIPLKLRVLQIKTFYIHLYF